MLRAQRQRCACPHLWIPDPRGYPFDPHSAHIRDDRTSCSICSDALIKNINLYDTRTLNNRFIFLISATERMRHDSAVIVTLRVFGVQGRIPGARDPRGRANSLLAPARGGQMMFLLLLRFSLDWYDIQIDFDQYTFMLLLQRHNHKHISYRR